MKKILLSSAIALVLSGAAAADRKTVYISPNNDGTQDFLEVPVQIKDRRYVTEWSFIVENDRGEVVRTIRNKEKRDEDLTFKSFFKRLFTPKNSVEIPQSISWNGVTDSGEIAPDGSYRYYMTATDDNGNTAMTEKLDVVVDNTPPDITLEQPGNGKIFGEGSKVTLGIRQSGSAEDEWTGVFSDARGNPVRTIKWTESAPLSFEWNGTDDKGLPLPDGVYSYKVSATDRAGNKSAPATISNIIYSAEKPATSISLSDGKYFSPRGNSDTKTMKFDVKIPVPAANSGNRLTFWSVEIVDEKGKVHRTFSGSENPPEKIEWDGKDGSGNFSAEGNGYQATVKAKYLNGFETAPMNSPVFTLDNTPPRASISAASKTFSPDGDGNLDTLTVSQKVEKDEIGAPIDDWRGKILNASGEVVNEFDFGAYPPEKFEWNGMTAKNEIADDGTYRYVLSASDGAGNRSEFSIADINLDTSKTELLLTLNKTAFNPNRPADIKITPVIKSKSGIEGYEFSILSDDGKEVWSQSGGSSLGAFTWNGKDSGGNPCADGNYTALLVTKSKNGEESSVKSQKFAIDTVPPSAEIEAAFSVFSPDGDGKKDAIPFSAKTSDEESWTAHVYNSKNESVRTYTWKGEIPDFEFDGTDANGNTLPDGTYRMVVSAEDAAGNRTTKEIGNIVIDNRDTKAYVTAEHDAFSPNGDGILDEQKFTLNPSLKDGIESWKVSVVSAEGKAVRTWSSETLNALPSSILWDGKDDEGKAAPDNIYTARLNVSYEKGNVIDTDSPAFISCSTPPKASVRTLPEYFSPDNDGTDDDLFIQLKADTLLPLKEWTFQINDPRGRKFWTTGGKNSITEKLIWDGKSNSGELVQSAMDYPYVFTVTDSLGMTSKVEGTIPIDILLVNDNGRLKMAVPSIIFRSDAADFKGEGEPGVAKGKGLPQSTIDNNERVLKRIAVVLNKFKNYDVTIEGHANSMTGTAAEEETDNPAQWGPALKPLSLNRAKFVRDRLVKYGVDRNRLSVQGLGGPRPIVNIRDEENKWKNRRVEFILDKNKK